VNRDEVLLLGGTGFIGSALATRLQQEKITVHVLGRDQVERLEAILPRCGTVVHLASGTTPGSSAAQPHLELDNVNLTLRVLGLLRQQPQTHLVFFSSGGTIYGNPRQLPVAEDSPVAPLSNHGVGKASQEASCLAARAQGHAVTILRPSNAYGPGQTLKRGFGLVRTMLEHARAGTPLEIWGDGENVRDFIYIDDIVEACMRLMQLPEDSGTYNLGSGVGFTINQVRRFVEATAAKHLETIYRPAREVDVRSVVLDISSISARLHWQPAVGMMDGLQKTWASLQQP
jgi:UDP-glucose 4-epimerase